MTPVPAPATQPAVPPVALASVVPVALPTVLPAVLVAVVWLLSVPSPAALRLARLFPAASVRRRPWPHVAVAAIRWIRRTRAVPGGGRREADARRASVVELCDGIAAELSAGRPPDVALAAAARDLPGLSRLPALSALATAPSAGDDIAVVLDLAARTPGCEGLRLLAGCWRIGVDRGGMLAAVVEGLADALRDEQAHRQDIAIQLAGPRATARLLAALPLLGLAMGAALGARPLAFLLGTLPGGACLCLGAGLDALGLWWTRRIATAAEETR